MKVFFSVGEASGDQHAANLMWMNRLSAGQSRLGFQFESSGSLALLEAYRESSAEASDE